MPCRAPPPTWCFGFLLGNKLAVEEGAFGAGSLQLHSRTALTRQLRARAWGEEGAPHGRAPPPQAAPPLAGPRACGFPTRWASKNHRQRCHLTVGRQLALCSWKLQSRKGGGGVKRGQGREGHEGKGKKQERGGLKPD